MPNYCSNGMTITGPIDTIKAVWERANTNNSGLLEAMVPIGEWQYGTAVATWGTKWDINIDGLEYEDNGDGTSTIQGWADSAWAPPTTAYDTFLENNEDCSIYATYIEEGMDFAGIYEDGDVEEETLSEIADIIQANGSAETLTGTQLRIYEEFEGSIDSIIEWREENDEDEE